MKTAENILNAAIGVIDARGRCRGHFELIDGSVDPLGALAVAAGLEPDTWMGLRGLPESQIKGVDRELVDASWFLAAAAVPRIETWHLPVDDMVRLLGDWADEASDAEVFDALTKAAHHAGQLSEALRAGETRG